MQICDISPKTDGVSVSVCARARVCGCVFVYDNREHSHIPQRKLKWQEMTFVDLPSNDVIANTVLRDLDLLFDDKNNATLTYLKTVGVSAKKCTRRLLQILTFAVEWHRLIFLGTSVFILIIYVVYMNVNSLETLYAASIKLVHYFIYLQC